MHDHTARTRAWLADLAAINSEIETSGVPSPRPFFRRVRKPRPFWEE